jgi:hypothetical protein
MLLYDPLQRALADSKLLGGFGERVDAPQRGVVIAGFRYFHYQPL